MSLLYCAVCSKDFVSASARTKHEATCTRPPLTLAELTKEFYTHKRETKRKIEKLERENDGFRKEINDLNRSRVGATVKGKPGPFPEITENDFWDFLDKGFLHLVCSKDWPVYADGGCIMVYKLCTESKEEAWQEALDEDLNSITTKIKNSLNAWMLKNVSKTQSTEESKGPERDWPKIVNIDSTAVKKAFLEANGNVF